MKADQLVLSRIGGDGGKVLGVCGRRFPGNWSGSVFCLFRPLSANLKIMDAWTSYMTTVFILPFSDHASFVSTC